MSRGNERLNNVQRLATILHYSPEQLREDIADLEAYTAEKVQADRAEQQDD